MIFLVNGGNWCQWYAIYKLFPGMNCSHIPAALPTTYQLASDMLQLSFTMVRWFGTCHASQIKYWDNLYKLTSLAWKNWSFYA